VTHPFVLPCITLYLNSHKFEFISNFVSLNKIGVTVGSPTTETINDDVVLIGLFVNNVISKKHMIRVSMVFLTTQLNYRS
jgi:hypothetical protein